MSERDLGDRFDTVCEWITANYGFEQESLGLKWKPDVITDLLLVERRDRHQDVFENVWTYRLSTPLWSVMGGKHLVGGVMRPYKLIGQKFLPRFVVRGH